MKRKIRKKHSNAFKLKVALAAVKGDTEIAEMIQEYGVAGTQIYAWKRQLEEGGEAVFADRRLAKNQKDEIEKLHRLIGKITAERDFLERVLDR